MLDTGSSVNFVSTRQVSRRLLNFQIKPSAVFKEVQKDVTIALCNLEGKRNRKTRIVMFGLSKPDGLKVEAYVVERIHSFAKLQLPESITTQFQMDQAYPRAKGEVDLFLGIIDTLKLIIAKHISISNTLALLPTCYGHIPCGQEIVQNIIAKPEQNHSTYLTSAEVLNKTLEKMWEIEKFPLDETPSSLTRDEARAIERINECMKYDMKQRLL